MMYADTYQLDFGPATTTRLATEPEHLLKRQSSFEDEVESIYLSASKTQELTWNSDNTMTNQFETLDVGLANNKDLDSVMMVAKPEDVTGQTLAIKTEPFDIDSFLEDSNIDQEETAEVIKDMEEFLSQFETRSDHNETMKQEEDVLPATLAEELLSMEQQQSFAVMQESQQVLGDKEMKQAEDLLDMLLADHQTDNSMSHEPIKRENLDDSGFDDTPAYLVSNVSQFQTTTGQKVVIVIQKQTADYKCSSAEAQCPAATVQSQEPSSDLSGVVSSDRYDSDSDWTPSPAPTTKRKPGRKPESRTTMSLTADGKVNKRSYKTIRDRKERKKIQNVEAARRYRDKKKQEQSAIEVEEEKLVVKNKELKENLVDMENEIKTMKKLMIELGLIKIVRS